ncbi:hypothetical protein H696_01809 [Fonticula alba]|uniref:SAM domain-containing protein n=1 Tax=Fonticula alba TaxID=691883 RepID=A0A058ZER4_FONAL|nr:hypothetical protein H696_01809 [Fonticula alba]KCV72413.1 hypothetical protein H696_01809 [Fonticula alba]|eukprot:XP_009493991.1 hypothetical protein H696_01809 [Fonticula alba]
MSSSSSGFVPYVVVATATLISYDADGVQVPFSMEPGEKITVLDNSGARPGMWKGINAAGHVGYFHSSMVNNQIGPANPAASAASAADPAPAAAPVDLVATPTSTLSLDLDSGSSQPGSPSLASTGGRQSGLKRALSRRTRNAGGSTIVPNVSLTLDGRITATPVTPLQTAAGDPGALQVSSDILLPPVDDDLPEVTSAPPTSAPVNLAPISPLDLDVSRLAGSDTGQALSTPTRALFSTSNSPALLPTDGPGSAAPLSPPELIDTAALNGSTAMSAGSPGADAAADQWSPPGSPAQLLLSQHLSKHSESDLEDIASATMAAMAAAAAAAPSRKHAPSNLTTSTRSARSLPTDIALWTVPMVSYWLRANGFEQLAPLFASQDINGEALLELGYSELYLLGITTPHARTKLMNTMQRLRYMGA